MAEPLNASRGLEPDPVPSDIAPSAPIRGDIERGYRRSDLDKHSDTGERRSDSETRVKDKHHGKGLTEGDADMEDIPYNRMALVMPSYVPFCILRIHD